MIGLAARKRMAAQRVLSNRLPDGQQVADNVALMRRMLADGEADARNMGMDPGVAANVAPSAALGVWLGSVFPGGYWDPKIRGNRIGDDHVGNINFGATGSTLFPAGILTRAAGIVQRYQHLVDPKRHPYDPSWGNPLTGTGTHVGDDPRDTRDIMKGVRAANGQRRK